MRIERRWRGTVVAGIFTAIGFLIFYGTDIQNNKFAQAWLTIAAIGAIFGGLMSILHSINQYKKTEQDENVED